MAERGRRGESRRANGIPNTDQDVISNNELARLHHEQKSAAMKLSGNERPRHDTARGQGTQWSDDDELKYEVKAHVRDTRALQACARWEDLVGRGVTHLILEDEDNVFKEIPVDVTQIQTIRSLTLMWSKVKVIPSHVIQSGIKKLSIQKCQLKSIDGVEAMNELVSLELMSDSLKKLPAEIGMMTSLVHLDVTGNSIKSVPASIGSLHSLKVLNLCGNCISELPMELTNLKLLHTLDASQNQQRELPSGIGKLTNLVTLRLSHNQLSALPPSFSQLQMLKHLFLSNNRFKQVPKLLSKLPELTTLNMISNHITEIPAAILNLVVLLLDRNELAEMSYSLFLCNRLETLSVQYNKIEELPILIVRLESLRALYVGGNKIKSLPDQLCQLTELRHLSLRETDIDDLPMKLDSLHELSIVDLDQTKVGIVYQNAVLRGGVKALFEQIGLRRRLREQPDDQVGLHVRRNKTRTTSTRERTHHQPELRPTKVPEPVAAQSNITQINHRMVDLTMAPATEKELTIGKRRSKAIVTQAIQQRR